MIRSMSLELSEPHAVQAVLGELDGEAVLLAEDGEDVVHRRVVVDHQHGRLVDAGAAAQRGGRVENAVVREGAHPAVPWNGLRAPTASDRHDATTRIARVLIRLPECCEPLPGRDGDGVPTAGARSDLTREGDHEGVAADPAVVDPDPPAHPLHQLAGQVEAHPEAAALPEQGRLHLVEGGEDPVGLGLRDPPAAVLRPRSGRRARRAGWRWSPAPISGENLSALSMRQARVRARRSGSAITRPASDGTLTEKRLRSADSMKREMVSPITTSSSQEVVFSRISPDSSWAIASRLSVSRARCSDSERSSRMPSSRALAGQPIAGVLHQAHPGLDLGQRGPQLVRGQHHEVALDPVDLAQLVEGDRLQLVGVSELARPALDHLAREQPADQCDDHEEEEALGEEVDRGGVEPAAGREADPQVDRRDGRRADQASAQPEAEAAGDDHQVEDQAQLGARTRRSGRRGRSRSRCRARAWRTVAVGSAGGWSGERWSSPG